MYAVSGLQNIGDSSLSHNRIEGRRNVEGTAPRYKTRELKKLEKWLPNGQFRSARTLAVVPLIWHLPLMDLQSLQARCEETCLWQGGYIDKRNKEPLYEYVAEAKNLARLAYPDLGPDFSYKEAQSCFKNRLPNAMLHRYFKSYLRPHHFLRL